MTYRTLRRRMSEAMAAHDWLGGVSFVIGLLFLVLAGVCLWGLVAAVTSWGDTDAAFRPGGNQATVGFLKVTRGFGVVLFALFAFLAAGVGWFFAGDRIRRLLGLRRREG